VHGDDGSSLTDTCSFTVTVTDTQPPVLAACPANITQAADPGVCTALVNYTAPSATDNCSAVTVVCAPAAGTVFASGTTTVTCTATDGSSLTDTCSFTVTVTDTQPPVLAACPANITQAADPGVCTALVNYTRPSATDNCSAVTVVCAPAAGTVFASGTTTVTCTATDASSLTDTCSFTVTVTDTQPPVLAACPANITQAADPGVCTALVNYTAPSATIIVQR